MGTVLIVDDERGIRKLLDMALKSAGHTTLTAGDGDEALRVAAEYAEAIDLLITDVIMPRIEGPELARRMAAAHPDLTVLYMSAHTKHDLVAGGLISREALHIAKPFETAHILAATQDLLG